MQLSGTRHVARKWHEGQAEERRFRHANVARLSDGVCVVRRYPDRGTALDHFHHALGFEWHGYITAMKSIGPRPQAVPPAVGWAAVALSKPKAPGRSGFFGCRPTDIITDAPIGGGHWSGWQEPGMQSRRAYRLVPRGEGSHGPNCPNMGSVGDPV
jgi:hypothetical protein